MDKYLEQDELDRLITRDLSRLPSFVPSLGFDRRVMAMVRLPEPQALIALRRARAWALQPRRALALAGAYAACAVIALALAVPWALQHSSYISFGVGLMATKVIGAARETGMAFAGSVLTSRSFQALRSMPVLREHFVMLFAVATVGYAAAAVTLHRLLKSPGGKRVPATPAR